MDWHNLNAEREYGRVGHQSYSQSKLALNMWTFQLARELKKAKHPAVVHSIDPGNAATKVGRPKVLFSASFHVCRVCCCRDA
jgi:NAD(P)-dependent dehydrogenase (short-subunit alcohol dehydrogenase family)